ncbi:MAG: hypothetical protein ACYTBP_17775 [Planctomycetota bacterium]|jgi:hypothetical protein
MGKIGDTVKILLDIDKVLAGDDFSGLTSVIEKGDTSVDTVKEKEIERSQK